MLRALGFAWLISVLSLAACGDDDTLGPQPDTPAGDAGMDGVTPPPPDSPTAPVLRVDFVDPDHGPFSGGTTAIVRGRGFTDGMSVTCDDRAVDPLDVQLIDDRRVVVVTPAGSPGPADVKVTVGA